MRGSARTRKFRSLIFARWWRALVCALPLLAALPFLADAQGRSEITGTVVDATDSPVAGAQIEFRSSAGTQKTGTDEEGRFHLTGVESGGTLVVSFPGFATVSREIRAHASPQILQIVLTPAPYLQRINVQGSTEDMIPATPASEYQISSQAMDQYGSMMLDDMLRQVPGFSTYRRSSSLFANPTSQGVSLRGIGASATSRSDVYLDGIPLNDPFGGWVYWARVPEQAVESMEVVNGGASDVYGGGALGGVVNLHTRSDETVFADSELSYGNMSTPNVSFAAGAPLGKWMFTGAGQAYQTQGYIAVPPDQRGSVDTALGSGVLTGYLEASRHLGERGQFFVRGSGFGNSGKGGTSLQTYNTTVAELDLGADWTSADLGTFSARAFGSRELYHQTFASIALNRDSESLTDVQRNPSQQIGFVGTWSRLFAEKHKVSAGFETQDIRGHSQDTNFLLEHETAVVDAGGRQFTYSFFAQDAYSFARTWQLNFGARVDTWSNNYGYQNRTPVAGAPTANTFPNRTESAFSPRVTLLKSLAHGTSVSASVYHGFRAPTLNELYRNFRVGNVLTLANPALTGEHLTGGEVGVSQLLWHDRLTLRGDFFWSDISGPVANVTLSSTPVLITRQKENLGESQARGFELAGQLQATPHWQFSGAYIFVNSIVLHYAANPALQGNFLPQAPQNQFSLQASYVQPLWSAGVQARFSGNQFDDDQNLLPLGRAFSLDAQIARKFGKHTSVFFAMQNLTDDRWYYEATPVLLWGPPIFVRGGVRFSWSGNQ